MSINVKTLKGKIYPQGNSGTIEIGTVTTGEAGTDAEVTNTGTRSNAVFNFKIPKGDKGDPGSIDDAYTKAETDAKFKNTSSNSTIDGYSADYINKKYSPEAILCTVPLSNPPDDYVANSDFIIKGFTEISKIGNNISLTQDGSIKIGDNINTIEITYQVGAAQNGGDQILNIYASKNNTKIPDSYRQTRPNSASSSLNGETRANSTTLVSVTKNDIINLVLVCPNKHGYVGGTIGGQSIVYVKKID